MLSAIILAAGESRRMGGHIKQLLKCGDKNFIETIILKLRSVNIPEIIVVLGANYKKIIQNTRLYNAKVLRNRDWREGQLSSLKVAIKELSSDSEGFILNPCDCPLVKNETYKKIIKFWQKNKNKIVIPTFKNIKGHPVIFPARFYGNLLSDDLPEGARTLIKKSQDSTKLVEVNDENVTVDIDTYNDYKLRLKVKG